MAGPDAATDADRLLLERIRDGDPGAFEAFVDRWGERILGFGMRVCGEREDARDVAQETLIQAYRGLADLQHPEALKSWLYRVASNACLMKRRRSKFAPHRELSLDELVPRDSGEAEAAVPDVSALPDDELERSELRQTVRDAIAGLPALYRIVLVLRDMEQLSTAETAEALDLPESTVKMRLHRARVMLRNRLAGIFHPEDHDTEGR